MVESFKVKDVETLFKNISQKGEYQAIYNIPYFPDCPHHIQGITKAYTKSNLSSSTSYTEYTIISHSSNGLIKGGCIYVQKSGDKKTTKRFYMPNKMKHPAGMQAIGPFVYIPCEKGNGMALYIFDIRTMEDENIKGFCYRQEFNHPGACVGITDCICEDEKGEKDYKYLLVVNENPKLHFYISRMCDDKDENGNLLLSFEEIKNPKDISLKEEFGYSDFEGMGLVTDESGTPYLIAFNMHKETHNVDRMCLLKINIVNGIPSVEKLKGDNSQVRTMVAVQKVILGELGVHFRWGTGLLVTHDNQIEITSTGRNIIGGEKVETNRWISNS